MTGYFEGLEHPFVAAFDLCSPSTPVEQQFAAAFGLRSPSTSVISTKAPGLPGFQPNADHRHETISSAGAKFSQESEYGTNSFAGFQQSHNTGFQPMRHIAFEPTAPKVKFIPRMVAGQPEKSGWSIPSIQRNFLGETEACRASSAAAGCSPEASDVKNSGAGFQPIFEPASRTKIDMQEAKKEVDLQHYDRWVRKKCKALYTKRYRATLAGKVKTRLAQQRYRATHKGKYMNRLAGQRYRATKAINLMKSDQNSRHYQKANHPRELHQSLNGSVKKTLIEASSKDIAREPAFKPTYLCMSGEIRWLSQSLTWELDLINPRVPLVQYLREHDLTLTIPDGLSKDDFEKAQVTTLLTAATVWNALDTSERFRVRLPDINLSKFRIKISEKSGLAKLEYDHQSDEDEESTTASSQSSR